MGGESGAASMIVPESFVLVSVVAESPIIIDVSGTDPSSGLFVEFDEQAASARTKNQRIAAA